MLKPDGQGGAFVLWNDARASATSYSDLYVAHLDNSGNSPAGWSSAGLAVSARATDENGDDFVPDGMGGFFAAYTEVTTFDAGAYNFLVQRLGPSGQPSPGWPVNGEYVARNPWDEGLGRMCSDGAHGAIIAWMDYRESYPYAFPGDCRAIRILGDGGVAPGWPDTGLSVAGGRGDQNVFSVVSDEAGGAYVLWNDVNVYPGDSSRVWAQHFDGNGVVVAGWPPNGLRVCPLESFQEAYQGIEDGAGGFVVAWLDARSAPPGADYPPDYGDVYATRVSFDGSHGAGWPEDGTPVCTAPGAQSQPRLCADGTGGALVGWVDNRDQLAQAYLGRVLGGGQLSPGWPIDGELVASNSEGVHELSLAGDAAGGAFVAWDNVTTTSRAFAQHILGDGSVAPGWAAFGTLMVDIAASEQADASIVSAEPGSAIMVWTDYRPNSAANLRAQKLVTDGPVPLELSSVSADAADGVVHVEWRGARAALQTLRVQRQAPGDGWVDVGAPTADGADVVTFTDRAVSAGLRYGYRLVDTSGNAVGGEAWVVVPEAARFELAGAQPNPARAGDLSVRFSLASAGAGSLELVDLAGRRRAWRDLKGLAAGEHLERMPETAGFEPGLYWLRLRQGSHVATTRLALVP